MLGVGCAWGDRGGAQLRDARSLACFLGGLLIGPLIAAHRYRYTGRRSLEEGPVLDQLFGRDINSPTPAVNGLGGLLDANL
eukprot:scaffold21733_cov101-Isochrysis_galbana.AAC.1